MVQEQHEKENSSKEKNLKKEIHATAALPPRNETTVPTGQEGWTRWTGEIIPASPGNRTPVV